MEIQAIANVTEADVVHAISELPVYEISDLFLQVVEKLNSPSDINNIAHRLLMHSKKRYGHG